MSLLHVFIVVVNTCVYEYTVHYHKRQYLEYLKMYLWNVSDVVNWKDLKHWWWKLNDPPLSDRSMLGCFTALFIVQKKKKQRWPGVGLENIYNYNVHPSIFVMIFLWYLEKKIWISFSRSQVNKIAVTQVLVIKGFILLHRKVHLAVDLDSEINKM